MICVTDHSTRHGRFKPPSFESLWDSSVHFLTTPVAYCTLTSKEDVKQPIDGPRRSDACRCHHDPDARHGPYHYWTRKARGKTVGLKLTEDELGLYSVTGCGTDFLQCKWAEMDRAAGEVAA